MTTRMIRQQLHNYLEIVNDKKVKAIFTMVENEIKAENTIWTDDFKTEMNARYNEYNSNIELAFSEKESKARVKKILNSLKK
jgi:hypothetical protein